MNILRFQVIFSQVVCLLRSPLCMPYAVTSRDFIFVVEQNYSLFLLTEKLDMVHGAKGGNGSGFILIVGIITR